MDKPKGRWRCRACGQEWHGNQLYDDPNSIAVTWTCADLGCGGICDRIYKIVAEERGATATLAESRPKKLSRRKRGRRKKTT